MRRIVVSALVLALFGCSDDSGPRDGLPSDLVPSNSLLVVRIANPEALDRELQELGGSPTPPISSFLPLLGVFSEEGVDLSRPWYLFWAEDAEEREMPLVLLPLSDRGSFEESLEASPGGLTSRFGEGYALLGRGSLPELGHSALATGFTGDIEAHADLAALHAAYADQIEEARGTFEETMDMGLQESPEAPSTPGFDPAAMGQMVKAQSDMIFGILEQSEEVGLVLDLNEGELTWAMEWALEPGTSWGRLVSDQKPKAPSGLGRVDLGRPMVFWMSFDMSENRELLQPFFEAISGVMEGLDPEVFLRLAGQQMEGVMSMGWDGQGMAMEAVYSVPDIAVSEYRDLVREQMTEMAQELPGIEMEYRQDIGRVGDMQVDLLVQEIQGLEDEEIPFPLQRTEVYYGWGEDEFLMVMATGENEGGGMERLGALASRDVGPVPDQIQQYLEFFPRDLLMLTWIDVAGMVEGFASMAPDSPEVPSLPEGIPPMVLYGTADGSRIIYGGSMNLKAVASAASSARAGG